MNWDDTDALGKQIAAVLLFVWLMYVGMMYHKSYPKEMVELAGHPLWRLLLVSGAAAAAYWCPRVGVLAALAVILYLADMRGLTQS
jgi:hypothetical protein